MRYASGMETMLALLRGINVGGRNRLPMKDLRELLAELGCEDARTLVQSGNAVFRYDDEMATLSRDIREAINARFGFAPEVMVLAASRFESIVAGNPYGNAVVDPRTVHVSFLAEEAFTPDIDRMKKECRANESFHLTKHALYFHAPDGIGRSVFANNVEKRLGVAATGRNWRTVCKIAEMLPSHV